MKFKQRIKANCNSVLQTCWSERYKIGINKITVFTNIQAVRRKEGIYENRIAILIEKDRDTQRQEEQSRVEKSRINRKYKLKNKNAECTQVFVIEN